TEKRRSRRKFGALQAMPPKCRSDPRYRLPATIRPARCSARRPLRPWSPAGSPSVPPAGSSLAPSIGRPSTLKFQPGAKALVTVAPAKILYPSPPPGETRSTHINFRIDLDAACQVSIVLMKKKILRSNLRERVVAQLLRRNCSSLARRKAIAPARRLVLFP